MRIDIVTIFPGMFGEVFRFGILSRAVEAGLVHLHVHNLRDWTRDRHRTTDDSPYGGGPGMVMKVEPLVLAVESILVAGGLNRDRRRVILLSPRGTPISQSKVVELGSLEQLVVVAGRYEGVDERFISSLGPEHAEEVSIGDYVLSGGEIPAMVLVDAVVRLQPGAMSDPDSFNEDSFSRGLLDFPHYTRPQEFRGLRVPEVLLSGDHGEIREWRKRQAVLATHDRRPEILSQQIKE